MARKGKGTKSKNEDKELRTLRQRLDALLARAKRTEKEAERIYARQRQVLRARQSQAKQAVQRLGRRSAAAAPPLKAGLKRAWQDLNQAVREAAAQFRKTS